MGPVGVDAPLSWLDKITYRPDGFGEAWADRVREYYAENKRRAHFAADLKRGDIISLFGHTYMVSALPGKGWRKWGLVLAGGGYYTAALRQIKRAERVAL